MSRGKAINVKIATTKVIKALEAKLAQVQKDKASQASNEAKFEKAMEKYNKELGKLAVAHINKAENFRVNTRYNGLVNVDFDLPAGTITIPEAPQRDFTSLNDWQYKEMIEEIENAIRILKMTDEEVVSTSTYNAIARYL